MSKFDLGQVVMTRGIASEIEQSKAFAQFVTASLKRHATGDWGEMCEEDKNSNEYALKHGERIFSAYIKEDWKIWIITEWDRSVTTILFPSEY
jgi:hypothetical protein